VSERACRLDLEIRPEPPGFRHDDRICVGAARIVRRIGAHGQRQVSAFRGHLEDDHPRRAAGAQHGHAREADRPCAVHDGERAGPHPACRVHERVVDDRERLDHRAAVVQLGIACQTRPQRRDRPAIAGRDPDVLREPAVQAEPDLVQVLAVVGLVDPAWMTGATADHVLDRDRLALTHVRHGGSNGDHVAGELVSEDDWKARQARIADIAVGVGFEEM